MVNDIWALVKTHQEILQGATLISLISFVILFSTAPFIILYLPKDYLIKDRIPTNVPNFVRQPYKVMKNILGGFLVLAGLAMLILPGQGVLTLVVGISLMNIPGKRKIIRRIACYALVFNTINRLRNKAGRPPLEIPECYT